MDRRLTDLTASRPRASIPTLLATLLPAALATALVNAVGIDQDVGASQLARSDRRRLVHALVEWHLSIRDTRGYNYAEATAGGVELTEIDPSTMESRTCPGLYLVGEVLDVDGELAVSTSSGPGPGAVAASISDLGFGLRAGLRPRESFAEPGACGAWSHESSHRP
jgi:hypothetical protein